jgi:LVIVD repeat-containing protein
MRAGRTWSLAAAVLVVLTLAAPAAAHENQLGSSWLTEDHPGWYWPSTSSQTSNFEMVGSVERTRYDSAYRNSDLAFWGDKAFAGHYDGFQIIDASNPRKPERLVDFACPGSQHDVSVWGGLLFVSVETPRSSPACDSTTQSPGFEGIRIFDVSNPRSPHLVTGVPTDCGSHTHTLVPDPRHNRVLLYVASYTSPTSDLPVSAYGNECRRYEADGSPAQNKISVVEVPLRDPASASVVSEPRFPQKVYGGGRTGCHDITVFMELEMAGAACMGEGQIWDISDLEHPETVGRVFNPNVEFWHSATFSYDGRRVVFGDEAGGGTGPACTSADPETRGALWFYDVRRIDSLEEEVVPPRSSWKVPRIQEKLTPEQAQHPNCTMHNFNTLPTKRGDVLVSSAYAAGTTMVDFTNASDPREVGHLDPHGANTWSAYWYNGYVFTNDGGRGVDILRVRDRATKGARKLPFSNPQTQLSQIR